MKILYFMPSSVIELTLHVLPQYNSSLKFAMYKKYKTYNLHNTRRKRARYSKRHNDKACNRLNKDKHIPFLRRFCENSRGAAFKFSAVENGKEWLILCTL